MVHQHASSGRTCPPLWQRTQLSSKNTCACYYGLQFQSLGLGLVLGAQDDIEGRLSQPRPSQWDGHLKI